MGDIHPPLSASTRSVALFLNHYLEVKKGGGDVTHVYLLRKCWHLMRIYLIRKKRKAISLPN